MRNKLSSIIGQRLPEYLRFGEQGNNFELFLKAYYEFLEKKLGATGIVNNHLEYIDVDHTLEEFVDNFFKEFGEYIPQKTAHDKKLILKKLYTLYKSKGTEPAVRLFFKMIYGVTPFVEGQNFLKASNGKWEQLLCVRVLVSTDALNIDNVLQREIRWKNKSGLQSAIIQNIREVKTGVFDIFFLNTTTYLADVNDPVVFLDIDGTVLHSGFIRLIPTNISIIKPGVGYREGQIFRLEAEDRDTVIRVSAINPDTSIKKIEFIDIGGDYSGNRSYIISPYNPLLDISYRLYVDENGLPVIELKDKIESFIEKVNISKDTNSFDPNGYFAEQYIQDEPYNTIILRSYTEDNTVTTNTRPFESEVTEEIYQASLTLISLNLGTIAKYPGRYVNDEGQLSNSNIKLQDSLLYQKFSYVIESPIQIKVYREAFKKLIHPSGYKFFSRLSLENRADLSELLGIHIIRDIDVSINDDAGTTDRVSKHIDSLKLTDQIVTDSDKTRSYDDEEYDSESYNELDIDAVYKSVSTPRFSTAGTNSIASKLVDKSAVSIINTPTDGITTQRNFLITSDVIVESNPNILRVRLLFDSVIARDTTIGYDENYFVDNENYDEPPTDTIYKSVTPSVNESIIISESLNKDITALRQDNVLSLSLASNSFLTKNNDESFVSDNSFINTNKNENENTSANDIIRETFIAKSEYDSAIIIDDNSIDRPGFYKDDITLSDTLEIAGDYNYNLNDSTNTTSLTILNISLDKFINELNTTDEITKITELSLSDSVDVIDYIALDSPGNIFDVIVTSDSIFIDGVYYIDLFSTANVSDVVGKSVSTQEENTIEIIDFSDAYRSIDLSDEITLSDSIEKINNEVNLKDDTPAEDTINKMLTGESYTTHRTYFAQQYVEYSTFAV